MTSTPIPLPIHPWPMSEERAALLRAAKGAIDTPLKIYPVPAVPGSPGRTLAFGSVPPHYATSALIAPENVDRVESITGALRAILTVPEGGPGFFTGVQWFEAVWPGAKFVGEEQLDAPAPVEQQVRFY